MIALRGPITEISLFKLFENKRGTEIMFQK